MADIGGVVLALVAFGVVLGLCSRKEPSDYDIEKLPKDAKKADVRRIFGAPSGVTKGGMYHERWVYTIPYRLYVSVSFDQTGRMIACYSHMSN